MRHHVNGTHVFLLLALLLVCDLFVVGPVGWAAAFIIYRQLGIEVIGT